MSKKQNSIDVQEDEENRRDFELLLLNHNGHNNETTNNSATNNNNENEIWPLYLTTNFLDHYIFGDVIGNGAYAEVRECVDTRNLERCAVKIVNKNYLIRQAPLALANQEQEIKLLKRLKHDNVISIKETLYKGSKIYIFLEHCSFVLSDLLPATTSDNVEPQERDTNDLNRNSNRNSLLSLKLIRIFFLQLLNGLNYLHSQSIIHRDIKPQNLLITTSGVLKIIDFGVSQILSIWNWPSDLCRNYEGSPLFQAPEVVSGQLEYHGFKVDVWSAGVTLYLMSYGLYPFSDETLLALYDKILSDPLEFPSFEIIPKKAGECKKTTTNRQYFTTAVVLNDLLSSMLEKETEKRCSIEEALKHPWLMFNSCGDNFSNHDDYEEHDEYDEHSEFIELLHQHHLTRKLANSSNSSLSPSLSSSRAANLSQQQYKETKHNKENKSQLKMTDVRDDVSASATGKSKQRDIYLSMSVLPYLYNLHFPHIPVVKAKRVERRPALPTLEEEVEAEVANSSNSDSSIINSTCSSGAKSSSSGAESSSTTNTNNTNPNLTQASTPSSGANSPLSESDPNEFITEQNIEWGTERQYNLLRLPLIRANRLKGAKKSSVKKKRSLKPRRLLRKGRTCRRRCNDDGPENNYEKY